MGKKHHAASEQKEYIQKMEKRNEQLRERLWIAEAVSKLFITSYFITMKNHRYKQLGTTDSCKEVFEYDQDVFVHLKRFAKKAVCEEDQIKMMAFFDAATIQKRLQESPVITQEFYNTETQKWSRAYFIGGDQGENGEYLHVLYGCCDFSREKAEAIKAEALAQEVHQAEDRYRTLHRLIKFGMWNIDYDEAGKQIRVEWSDEFRRMIGFHDENDFPNTLKAWSDLLHPDDWKVGYDTIGKVLGDREGKAVYDVEYRLNTKDRGWRWFRATGDVSRRPDGTPVRFYGVFFDITDQKEKEQIEKEIEWALEHAQNAAVAMAIIHEALGSGNWSMEFNQKGEMESCFWSDAFRKMIGYENQENFPNVLASWSDLLHKDDKERILKEYWDTVRDYSGEKTYNVEYRLMTKHAGWRWFHAAGRLTRRHDGSPVTFYGVFIDIDDRKTAAQALEDALAAAQHANRAKTVFLNNMSHDIRTPMNAIIGFTSFAAAHIENTELVKNYLSKITTSSNHLLSLINDVLDMSRIESGKVKIEEKEARLPEIMHDLKTIVQSDIYSKQLEFYIDTVDVVDEDIICDKLRLNQVLLNILSNAMKFTKSGGMVSVRVIQRSGAPQGYAAYEFRVKDTGIGMSRKFQEHIFEPFEREQSSTISGIQGTGLGMAITKNIVTMMGGTIEVHSEEGKGSEFIVSLQFRTSGNPVQHEPIPELMGQRALVADDDYYTCASVTKMLRSIGMCPDWTTSGKEAVLRTKLAAEQSDEFHVYIIDWLMPDMNGIETVRRIRRIIGSSKLIILLTAYDWADIEEEAREAGVTAFCSKPMFMSELREMLSRPIPVYNKPEKTEEPGHNFEGKKILLVEDNVLNQEIAITLLTEAGFIVDTADDGTAAVDRMKKAEPDAYDLILMDIQMPYMDGYEATRLIRVLEDRKKADIPIIAMTANAFEEDKKNALEAGMNGHIAKPINVNQLFESLSVILK